MTKDEITRRVQKCIAESLGVEDNRATPEATFESLGADSLDRLELSMMLEHEFGFEIPDADGEKLKTVQQVIDYVAGRVAT